MDNYQTITRLIKIHLKIKRILCENETIIKKTGSSGSFDPHYGYSMLTELADVIKMKENLTQELLNLKNLNPSHSQNSLFDPATLFEIDDLFPKYDQELLESIPILLEHVADKNPLLYPTDTLAESYDYLSDQVANPPSRSWTLKRLIKSIGKNRYHVLLGTMISTSTLIAGGILFYGHLYQPFTGIYPDKDAFLSQQNFTDGNKYGHLYRDPPFFTHWGEDSPITFWNTNFWDKIPGYELLTNRNNCHDGGKCDGNVTTWIRHLSLDTGCSFDYWYAQLQSVINNTDIFNQTILPCHPSPDNKTICCGTIWDGYKDWKRDTWHCEQRYCMRMFYGNFDSLVESYNKSLLSWEMKQNLRLGLFYVYCIFAAPLFSLTYVWIMLWTHYCL